MSQSYLTEAAQSIVELALEKLSVLMRQDDHLIKDVCESFDSFLKLGLSKVRDISDLEYFNSQVMSIMGVAEMLWDASPESSSHWARPLISECYEICGIDTSDRRLMIIHGNDTDDFILFPDVLENIADDDIDISKIDAKIDVLRIPSEAKFDLASISLVAHEVGHVYWQENKVNLISLGELDEAISGINEFVEGDFESKERISSYIEEYFCDHVGRLLLGPAFDFALIKSLIPYTGTSACIDYENKSHPPEKYRIKKSLESLKAYRVSSAELQDLLGKMEEGWADVLKKRLKEWEKEEEAWEDKVALLQTENAIKKIKIPSPLYSGGGLANDLDSIWSTVLRELDEFRPPFEKVSKDNPEIISPLQAIVGTTIYYYGSQYQRSNQFFKHNQDHMALRRHLVQHLQYVISLYHFVKEARRIGRKRFDFSRKLRYTLWPMRDRIENDEPRPFVVVPSIEPMDQYSFNSVDLRLGPFFLAHRPPRYVHIPTSPNEKGVLKYPLENFYEEIYRPISSDFVLHPHQFVLASTLEYISIPLDYYALVLGRSTWGRLGLNIATATTVQAGYRGCLTLELRNLGETPLPLKIGSRIAQICLIALSTGDKTKGYYASDGKYVGPIGPEIPRIENDKDWNILNKIKTK